MEHYERQNKHPSDTEAIFIQLMQELSDNNDPITIYRFETD